MTHPCGWVIFIENENDSNFFKFRFIALFQIPVILSAGDRFHLGALGEYVAGYSWFVYLTGQPIEELKYIDDSVGSSETNRQAILDAVNASFRDPFTVTDVSQ